MKKSVILTAVILFLAALAGCAGVPAVTAPADTSFNGTTAEQTSDTETEYVTETEPAKIILKETDAQLDVWYNHAFNKTAANVKPTELRSAGTEDYTVYMAKNEYENAQLCLYAPAGIKGISVELSGIDDRYGNSLQTDIFRVYSVSYSDGRDYPDIMVPMNEKIDTIDIKKKNSQVIIVRIRTEKDTKPGDYSGDLTVKQYGEPVRVCPLNCHVWNFEIPDTPSSKSAMGIWDQIKNYGNDTDYNELYKSYYDFVIDYRISPYYLPYDVTDSQADAYMSDPRVTSFIVPQTNAVYNKLKKNDDWINKAYFYAVDEPSDKAALDKLAAVYGKLKKNFPMIRTIAPFYVSAVYDENTDGIDFMRDYIDIWCPVAAGFTEGGVANGKDIVSIYPTEEAAQKYPWLSERMAEVTKESGELWWYVCSYPTIKKYCNLMIDYTGLQNRVLFWQQKQYNVTGFLYWACTYWNKDPWSSRDFNRDGSLLAYGKEELGYTGPCSTLRFEAVRDGLDDYDMLCMCEKLCGADKMNEILNKVTTNILEYTDSDAVFAAARIELGSAVESAQQ